MPVFDQVELVCEQIKNDPQLQGGFHALGFSQGAHLGGFGGFPPI